MSEFKNFRVSMALAFGSMFCAVIASAAPQTYCAVEVGSKGIKGAAYTFDDVGESLQVKTLFGRSSNTSLINTASQDGYFTDDGMKDASTAAADLLKAAEKAAPGCSRLVVVSSGVHERGSKSIGALAAMLQKTTGAPEVDVIDAAAEADFALRSSVPQKNLLPESILYDIGSGNTKIGYTNSSDGRFNSISLRWGSASFTKDALADMGEFRHGLAKLMVTKVVPDFQQKVQSAPAILNRKRVYWVGGAAWATSMWAYPEKISAPLIEFTALDLDNFIIALQNKTWTERVPPKNMSAADRELWAKEFARLQEVFTPENLQSGVGIMRTLLQQGNPKARIYFPRNGQWLYGYTLSKSRQE